VVENDNCLIYSTFPKSKYRLNKLTIKILSFKIDSYVGLFVSEQ
jgi:hypothetical protein